jgi:hypothetical protein
MSVADALHLEPAEEVTPAKTGSLPPAHAGVHMLLRPDGFPRLPSCKTGVRGNDGGTARRTRTISFSDAIGTTKKPLLDREGQEEVPWTENYQNPAVGRSNGLELP